MAPGCRTIFMLMSADGKYSFENTLHFSWGSLSPMHVTVSHLKAMIRLLPGDPLWAELCMTVSNLTICLFRAFWSHFNDVSKCFMDKYRIRMKILSTYALNLRLCNWDSVLAANSSHLRSRFFFIYWQIFTNPQKNIDIQNIYHSVYSIVSKKEFSFSYLLICFVVPSTCLEGDKTLGGEFCH